MNIKGLRVFVAVMTQGTLASAGETLNTSESAASRQLLLLEASLGISLFKRDKRSLVPTPEGEAFFREAKTILLYLDQLPAVVEKIKRDIRRSLHLIVMPRLATTIAVPAVQEFVAEQSTTEVLLNVQPRFFWEHLIAKKPFDIGLGAIPTQAATIEYEEICTVAPVLLVSSSHPFALEGRIEVKKLNDEKFIMMSPETLTARNAAVIFESLGISPTSNIQVSQSDILCDFVASGAGVAIHDPLIPASFSDRITMLALETTVKMRFGLFYPSGVKRSAYVLDLAEALASHTRSYLKQVQVVEAV